MGLFSMFKKKKKDEFGDTGADPFAGGADPFASTPGADPFAGGTDPFTAKEPFPGPEADFSKASTQAGLSPEPTQRPLGMINEPQPVPPTPQPIPDTSKDIEVISSKLDALRSQIESISIKVDHVETLIKNQAEAAKQRW